MLGDADADGRLDGSNPTWVGDHGFLDKPEDTSALTAIGARMYDPVLGKFITVDPIMDLTDPQQWNAYSYSNGNPVTLSDPTGLKPLGGNGGAEENKWANNVSKRMNRDARRQSRSTPAPSTSYDGEGSYYYGEGRYYSGGGGKAGADATRKPPVKKPLNLDAKSTNPLDESAHWQQWKRDGKAVADGAARAADWIAGKATAIWDWSLEHKHEIANWAVFGLGVAAGIRCVVTAGAACVVMGLAAIGAGAANNAWNGMDTGQVVGLAIFQTVTLGWGAGIGQGLNSLGSTGLGTVAGLVTGVPGAVCLGTVSRSGSTRC